ncbi:MAG TPA: ABC transporter permease subunit [Planctomycetota bacterium]|nr:ABC transporter permease subunit [Planctomycetota bacterium]
MSVLRQARAIGRLELAEVLRSRWLWFCAGVYALLSAVFVLVGLRESSVLGFTGMGRVLLSFSHALVLLLPLLGLFASGQVINRGRDDGSLELWFSHPVTRGTYFAAVSVVRLLVLLLPLLVLMPALGLFGRIAFGQAVPWGFLARTLGVSAALLAAAVAAGLLVSTFVRNQAKALMVLLLLWALGAALLDFALIGLMLQWQVRPLLVFALAALNPVQGARLALLASAEPELGHLGPVGFFLANRVGEAGLVALGIGWPTLLAATCWLLSLHRFRRGDLV